MWIKKTIIFLLCITISIVMSGCINKPEKSVFDEMYNALTQNKYRTRSKTSFQYAFSRMRSLTEERNSIDIYGDNLSSISFIKYYDRENIEYLMEIRCFKNAVMRMYTNRESEKGIYTSVIYQYNTNNNMLETSLQVHNPLKSEQRVGEEERVEANLATEIMSGFIIEFIENNEVKSLFSQNDWGEYLLKDYGVTIL